MRAPLKRDAARVVFVCEHGSAKSVIAASLLNRLAAERGLAAHGVARGTVPDSEVPALVRDGLRSDGVHVGAVRPEGLGAADAHGAALFVAFDLDVPASAAGDVPVRRWDGMPPVATAYPAARDAIAARVARLVAELEDVHSAFGGRS